MLVCYSPSVPYDSWPPEDDVTWYPDDERPPSPHFCTNVNEKPAVMRPGRLRQNSACGIVGDLVLLPQHQRELQNKAAQTRS